MCGIPSVDEKVSVPVSAQLTSHRLLQRIWRLSWPMVAYNLLEMMVGFVDLLMVRPLGPEATAAIGVSRQVTFLVEGAVVAISTGVLALVSQGVGARSARQVDSVARQSVSLVLLIGIPISILGWLLSGPILAGLEVSPATRLHAAPYLRVYFAGVLFLWGGAVGTAIFRGAGDAMTPLKLAVVVNLLNVLLNYGLIFGIGSFAGFGVQGAALATVGARGVGLILCLALLRRGASRVRLRFDDEPSNPAAPNAERGRSGFQEAGLGAGGDREIRARILKIGVPMALTGLLRNSSRLAFLAIVGGSRMGMVFQAAVGIGLQVRLLSILPATAFQAATAALVGQAIGRGDYREAEALGWKSLQLLAALMVVAVGLILLLADPIAAALVESVEAARLGATVLRWFAVAQLFSGLSIGVQGTLMGAGDTRPALRYTLVTQWLVMAPLTWVLANWVGWLPAGPLAAWTLAPAIALLLMLRRFRSGRWMGDFRRDAAVAGDAGRNTGANS